MATPLGKYLSRAKNEIVHDILAESLPEGLKSFAAMHDFVDANEYGGVTDDAFIGGDDLTPDDVAKLQEMLDAWIASGEADRLSYHSQDRWVEEFGYAYEIPAVITDAIKYDGTDGLIDISWHNNTCPSFTFQSIYDAMTSGRVDAIHIELWVEHPDLTMREYYEEGQPTMGAARRFCVSDVNDEEAYCGDDVNEALKVLTAIRDRIAECDSEVKA